MDGLPEISNLQHGRLHVPRHPRWLSSVPTKREIAPHKNGGASSKREEALHGCGKARTASCVRRAWWWSVRELITLSVGVHAHCLSRTLRARRNAGRDKKTRPSGAPPLLDLLCARRCGMRCSGSESL